MHETFAFYSYVHQISDMFTYTQHKHTYAQ